MRPVWWGVLFIVVCMPLVFVVFLVVAAKQPGMDAFTMKLPSGIREPVAELVLGGRDKESPKVIDRVLTLDPENSDAWSRRCTMYVNGDIHDKDIAACQKAVAINPTASNINDLGLAQEQAKDYCTAEDSFTRAIKASENNAIFLRNMARAALRCGHTGASDAGFEVAENLDAKAAADPDDDDDSKDDLLTDREYLAVVYDKMNQTEKANEVCIKAHPGWKPCHCELNDAGVKCSGAPNEPAQKK